MAEEAENIQERLLARCLLYVFQLFSFQFARFCRFVGYDRKVVSFDIDFAWYAFWTNNYGFQQFIVGLAIGTFLFDL